MSKITDKILLLVDYNENSQRPTIRNSFKNKFQFQEGKDYEFHNICNGKEYIRFFVSDEKFEEIKEQIGKHPHRLKYNVTQFPESRQVFGVSLPIDWQQDFERAQSLRNTNQE